MLKKQEQEFETLRKKALERLPSDSVPAETLSPAEAAALIHDLRVYQIELEIQNEELRNARDELTASHDRFSRLFHQAPVGYLVLNEIGLIQEANETFSVMVGRPISDLKNKSVSDLMMEADRPTFYGRYKALYKNPAGKSLELCMSGAQGRVIVVRLEAAMFTGTASTPATRQLFLAVSDITAHQQAEHERQALQVKLHQAQKTESLGRMAGAIAHHFNNLLTGVTGNLELALEDNSIHPSTREMLQGAMQAARQGADISTLMLAYMGQAVGRREAHDLVATCRESLLQEKSTLPGAITLKTNFPNAPVIIEANPAQLRLVLSNLFTNALEAIGNSRGEIHVSLKKIVAADIPSAHLHPPDWHVDAGAYICLSVRDTGAGMPAEDIEKAFEPFFSTKFTGRGLGLSVVLGIIKAHGGAIAIESQLSRGATFRIFLPLSSEPAIRKVEPTPTVTDSAPGLILVVDDEPAVRNLGKMILERFGHSVITASDGPEAIALFERRLREITCVLLDLTMPRMNGWQTLAALRQLRPDIPVILCSGYDQAQVMSEKQPEQPQVFLHKPYRMAELQEAVKTAVRAPGKHV